MLKISIIAINATHELKLSTFLVRVMITGTNTSKWFKILNDQINCCVLANFLFALTSIGHTVIIIADHFRILNTESGSRFKFTFEKVFTKISLMLEDELGLAVFNFIVSRLKPIRSNDKIRQTILTTEISTNNLCTKKVSQQSIWGVIKYTYTFWEPLNLWDI